MGLSASQHLLTKTRLIWPVAISILSLGLSQLEALRWSWWPLWVPGSVSPFPRWLPTNHCLAQDDWAFSTPCQPVIHCSHLLLCFSGVFSCHCVFCRFEPLLGHSESHLKEKALLAIDLFLKFLCSLSTGFSSWFNFFLCPRDPLPFFVFLTLLYSSVWMTSLRKALFFCRLPLHHISCSF